MTGDEMRDQLADVLSHWPIGNGYYATNVGSDDAREMADDLLPVVRKIAADELRAAADKLTWRNPAEGRELLYARADDLDPQ